jgi:hypothetical protein
MTWQYSHPQRAEQALLRAAATGGSSQCHAKIAESKLLDAANGGGVCAGPAAPTPAVLWGLQQLQAATDKVLAGGIDARSAVAAAVEPLQTAVGRIDWGHLHPDEAAAGLLAALCLMSLPADITVQVLVQTEDCLPAEVWGRVLRDVVVTAAAAGGGRKQLERQQQWEGSKLLMLVVQEVQIQCRVNERAPSLYKEVILAASAMVAAAGAAATAAASSGGSSSSSSNAAVHSDQHVECLKASLVPLLQLMLTGSGSSSSSSGSSRQGSSDGPEAAFRGVPLSASAAAQLVIELSRPQPRTSWQQQEDFTLTWQGGSAAASDAAAAVAAVQQLLIVDIAAAAALLHFTTTTSAAAAAADIFSNCIAQQLHQVALLPQLYLIMRLQPCLSQQHYKMAVQQSGLLSAADAVDAVAALHLLCHQLVPGKRLPLARYAQILTSALELTTSQDFTNVSSPEARLALQMECRHRQQQLLAAVVHVLGIFRGMRALIDSPTAAGLLLPSADLAAVLCYGWQLLPAGGGEDLAAAVAAAASRQQLVDVLLLLPSAAAAGFGKGPELWQPVLHCMAAAAGLTAAEEADVTEQVMAVAAEQVSQLPVIIDSSNAAVNKVCTAAPRAEPTEQRAAAAPTSPSSATGLAATDEVYQATTTDDDGAEVRSGQTLDLLEALAAVSVAVASSAAPGGQAAAGYGAAGAVGRLLWGAACLAAAALVAADSSTSSSNVKGTHDGSDANDCPDMPSTPSKIESSSAAAAAATAAAAAALDMAVSIRTTVPPVEASRAPLMGGRTKPPGTQDVGGSAAAVDPAAARYAGLGVAAAAAAVAGRSFNSGGWSVLGSLLVDPDEVLQKIRSQSAGLPVDEAMMQVGITQAMLSNGRGNDAGRDHSGRD